MKKNRNLLFAILGFVIVFISCKKSDFLSANNDQRQIIPKRIQDFQEILNYAPASVPGLLVDGADEYYWLRDQLNPGDLENFNAYTWNDNIWTGFWNASWNYPYNEIFKANIALNGLDKIKPEANQQSEWNEVKGHALFSRSFYFYQLLQLFAPVYDASTASNQPGIPLRIGSDVQEDLKRANLLESYNRVIEDLKEAKNLLPNISKFKSRPSAHAAVALLARVYLAMGDFSNSLNYASQCLGYNSDLLDYNTEIIERYNKEVIYSTELTFTNAPVYDYAPTAVDDALTNMYSSSDLRKTLFFADNGLGGKYFVGTYALINGATENLFAGLATDEIYLIRAECYARAGNIALALADLNTLMVKRWKNDGSWVPFTATSADEALQKILVERRKELVFRGLRWTDLRRLNKLGANVTIKRTLDDGTVLTLPPNNPKYTYLIPPNVIKFHPDWQQNAR